MVYILLGQGFEETEAIAPCDILRRGGVEVQLAGIGGTSVTGGHGITVAADLPVEEIQQENLEMIVLPGGLGGVASIRGCAAALDAVKTAWQTDKFVAAICAAPTVLAELGITEGRMATCYPGMEDRMGTARMTGRKAVRDGKLICGKAAGTAAEFGLELLRALKGDETAEQVRSSIHLDA